MAPEEAPISAETLSPVPGVRGNEGEAPPDINAIEEATSTVASASSSTTGRSRPIPTSLPVGNHVFPTAPEGGGPSATRGGKGVVASAATPGDSVDSRVTSTRGSAVTPTYDKTTEAVTSTPVATVSVTSTLDKRVKGTKTKLTRHKGGKEAEKEADGGYGEEEEAREEEGLGEEVASTRRGEERPEHTTTVGGGDSLFFRQLSRIESRDSEDPGTTRSHHLVLEKNTRLDYSSSRVVSEVYDSEDEDEEEEEVPEKVITAPSTTPFGLQEDFEGQSSAEEEVSDYGGGGMMEEDRHRATNGGDQEPAPSGGEAATSSQSQPTPAIATTTTSTAGDGVAVTTRKVNLIDEGVKDASRTNAPTSTTRPRTSVMETLKESGHGMGYATVQSMASTTSSYTPHTSQRLNLFQPSTTESPVKNEVTYNETMTGSAYDFKANLSYTTPMVHLLSPSSSTEVLEPESTVDPIQTTSPATSQQTTGQSLTEVLLVSTAETTPTTELSHTTEERIEGGNEQGGGNSINDWTTISSHEGNESSKEEESTSLPAAHSPAQSHESSTLPHSLDPIVTSSVLFTMAHNTSTSDLVSESMSVTSSASEETTSASSSTASASSESVGERVAIVTTTPFGNGSESSSESVPSSSSESPTEISNNVTTSPAPPLTSELVSATPSADVASSTSGDLFPDQEKTKVPMQGLVDKVVSTSSDSGSKEFGISEAITVQPMLTTTIQNTTSLKEILSSTPSTSKDSSPRTTLTPVVVKLNTSRASGMMDTLYNTSTSSGGEDKESDESIITYPWHVRLVMEVSWSEMCRSMPQSSLKQALAQLISSALMSNSAHSVLPSDRVLLLNAAESCPNASHSPSEVHFCILSAMEDSPSSQGEGRRVVAKESDGVKGTTVIHCDATLMQLFLNIWYKTPKPMGEPLMHVKEVGIAHSSLSADVPVNPTDDGRGVQAAIGISCIAALALFLLAALLIIMRRRQRRFNYGQRCTPVSLDAYSLDSVSVREGSRRGGQARNGDVGRRTVNGLSKGDGLNDWRASKRSYGNPAFEDDDGEEVLLSKPLNFAALTNVALDEDGALADEFRLIPKRFRRRTVRRKSRMRGKDAAGSAERGEAGVSKDEDDERLPEGAEEKNRYANVVPLTCTRVRLSARPSGPLSTYINANYVRGPKNEERFYIACQAPLQSTIEDFWRMVWEQQSKVILMLTNLFENSVEKCADYLPPSEVLDCHRLFGDFQVTLKKREVREKYVVSSLQLKNMESNLWREVTHLWFLGWPDQGVPDEANQVIAFLIEARSFIKTNHGPTVVHCSPGTGRTGTVIAIDICIREFEQSRTVDVPKVVQQLRRDREGAVQTLQQYAFIYTALSLYAAKLTGGAMDSF